MSNSENTAIREPAHCWTNHEQCRCLGTSTMGEICPARHLWWPAGSGSPPDRQSSPCREEAAQGRVPFPSPHRTQCHHLSSSVLRQSRESADLSWGDLFSCSFLISTRQRGQSKDLALPEPGYQPQVGLRQPLLEQGFWDFCKATAPVALLHTQCHTSSRSICRLE